MTNSSEGHLHLDLSAHAAGCRARCSVEILGLGEAIRDPFTDVYHYVQAGVFCGHCDEMVLVSPLLGTIAITVTCVGGAAKWHVAEVDATVHHCGERAEEDAVAVSNFEPVASA